jgi:hypothetical protein
MIYDDFFAEALVPLRHERRYRVFYQLLRAVMLIPLDVAHYSGMISPTVPI